MTIDKAFNKSAAYYDEWVQNALPGFKEAFSIATELVPYKKEARIRVLDLGAGTGLFSQFILKKYPKAEFVLYDLASQMLEVARGRFKEQLEQFEFIIDDYKNMNKAKLGEFDLVISSLSIHHLDGNEKKSLFRDIFAILKDKGVFINLDQIKGETKFLAQLYWDTWLRKTRANKVPEERIAAGMERRKLYDKDSTLKEQMRYLEEAGFKNVDCIYKNYFVGVFLGVKGEGE